MVELGPTDETVDEEVGTVILDGEEPGDQPRHLSHAPEPAFRSGDRIGRYELVRQLGVGGMGVVWLARDPRLDRTVAVKVLHRQRVSAAKAVERLRREAMALARLSHANVVAVYDVGVHEGQVFLAMEHIEGRTLDEWVKDRPESERGPDLATVLGVFEQAAAGLSAVHEAGFIHRDFKPSNVMIDEEGRVLVMDFGLARVCDPDTKSERDATVSSSALSLDASRLFSTVLTGDGMVMGTPAYMAPEQHMGEEADAHADQFAFFASLYEVLMGRRPFGGRTLKDLAFSKSDGTIDMSGGRLVLPRAVRAMLRRGLQPEPSRRHPDMETVRQQLDRLRRGGGRRWPVVAAGLGLALLGATGISGLRGQTTDDCETAGQHIAEVWGDPQRAQLQQAFEATEVSYASDAARRSIESLDDYTAQWSEARERACEQAASASVSIDLRMSCLRKASASLSSTVELMVNADSTAVKNAIAQVSGLPSLARCEDVEALEAAVALPEDPQVAAAVERIETDIESARALYLAGHYSRGIEVARKALADAEPLGHEPTIAQAKIRIASLEYQLGDVEATRRYLAEAAVEAAGAGDHQSAADAASQLIFICAEELNDPQEAMRWARHAEASMERIPPDPLLQAQLDANLGVVYAIEGRFAEAQVMFERCYEAEREIYGDEHPSVLGSLENLAINYGEMGHLAKAEKLQRQATEALGRVLGLGHPDYALALTNLGSSVGVLGQHDEAAEYYRQALQIYEQTLGSDNPMVGRTLGLLGHASGAQGNIEKAEEYYRKASEIYEKTLGPQHKEFVWSLIQRAGVSSELGREDEALALLARARAIVEQSDSSDHTLLVQMQMSQATSLIELSRFEEAEQALVQVGELIDTELEEGHPTRGYWHTIRGELHRAREQWSSARTELRLGLEIAEAAMGPDHPEAASILLSLGLVELELGEPSAALSHLRRAVEITEASPVGEGFRSAARFGLARALWTEPATRAEARQLAGQAREGFEAYGEIYAEQLEEIDAWRASHR